METNNKQSGQTIIETLAAIFILVTTLTVALGLAVSVLANSESGMKELVATNLARQSIEQVRAQRDSLWLNGGADPSTTHFRLCTDINAMCYRNVFRNNAGHGSGLAYRLTTPETNPNCDYTSTNCSRNLGFSRLIAYWGTGGMYALSADPTRFGIYIRNSGPPGNLYDNSLPTGCANEANCPPEFLRKIKLTRINVAPYSNNNNFSNWQTVVNVYVAWTGRRCNNDLDNEDPETLDTACKIVLEERLTNWKDYR